MQYYFVSLRVLFTAVTLYTSDITLRCPLSYSGSLQSRYAYLATNYVTSSLYTRLCIFHPFLKMTASRDYSHDLVDFEHLLKILSKSDQAFTRRSLKFVENSVLKQISLDCNSAKK